MGIILDANKKESGFNKDSTGSDDVEYVGVKHTLDDVFIHQKELDILKEQYSKSIVQDFCDNYHISKEDREKNRAEYEKIYKLRNMRSNCPRLSEYVKEWRIIIEIIREIAKNNKLIDENEFIAKSFTGKIHINGVKFPKYVGKKKKLINWEYIINDYILEDNKDPDELDYLTFDPLDLDSDDLDEDTLLDDPLIKNIVMSYKEKSDEDILNIIESGDPESGVISSSNKYSDKKLRKLYPELFRGIRNVKKIEDKLNRVKGIYHDLEEDDWDYLSKYDNSHKNSEEAPKFKGNWDNQDDIDEYINNLSEYEESLDWIKYNGRYYTRAEMEEIELKDMLEKNGWNLRNCFVDKEAEKRLKKQRKEDKIKEKKIKDMLAAIHNRREDREEKLGGLPQGINISEAKNKVKDSKKKKKKSKAEKKADKRMKIIFDADNDPEYKDKMEDFRWDL